MLVKKLGSFLWRPWGRKLNFVYGVLYVFTCFYTGFYPTRHDFDDFCKIEEQTFLAILMHGSSSSQKIGLGTSGQTLKSRFLARLIIFLVKITFHTKASIENFLNNVLNTLPARGLQSPRLPIKLRG